MKAVVLRRQAAVRQNKRAGKKGGRIMPAIKTRRVVIINFKGGVGKTTTAVNVCYGLAQQGFRVLLVDVDPQASSTFILAKASRHTLTDLFKRTATLDETIIPVRKNLDMIPSSKSLSSINTWLVESKVAQRVLVLDRMFADLDGYDFIVADTAPSFSLLNANAISFAEEAWVPVAMEYLALANIRELLHVLSRAEFNLNKKIRVSNVIPFLVDHRNKKTHQIMHMLEDIFGEAITNPVRTNVKISEANFHFQTVLEYDPLSHGAEDFNQLIRKIVGQNQPREKIKLDIGST